MHLRLSAAIVITTALVVTFSIGQRAHAYAPSTPVAQLQATCTSMTGPRHPAAGDRTERRTAWLPVIVVRAKRIHDALSGRFIDRDSRHL